MSGPHVHEGRCQTDPPMEPHPAPRERRDVAQRRSPLEPTCLPSTGQQPSWAARPRGRLQTTGVPTPDLSTLRWGRFGGWCRPVAKKRSRAPVRTTPSLAASGPDEPGQIVWVRFHATIPPRRVTPCPNSGHVERHVTMPARMATVGRHASSCEEVSLVEPTDMSPR